MDQLMWDYFMELHANLPRQGPGSFESTSKAFNSLPELPAAPKMLDIGCGPGLQTLDLVELSKGHITAVDFHQPFLDQLHESVLAKGVNDHIRIVKGDMNDLHFPGETFNLIWSEGAIYITGFENGLRNWRSFLKPGGYMAVSEITWLVPNVPKPVNEYWSAEYPGITDIRGNLSTIEKCGYQCIDHFRLPISDWMEHYFSPLEANLKSFKTKYNNNADAMQVAIMEEKEISMFKKNNRYFGYVFYMMRKPI